ncbi:MAG: ATP-binding protein [Pirellulaceae bacterium]|jgi:serine/threonine-protein kinase RsbW
MVLPFNPQDQPHESEFSLDFNAKPWTLDRVITSCTDEGQVAIQELMGALVEQGWDGSEFFQVNMAAEEAVVNAIEHGNKRDPCKSVHLLFRVSPTEIYLEITDQGAGFNPDTLPDPTDEDLIDKPRGRGVMLIKEFMSEVHYNDRGNSVVMIKRRSAETGDSDSNG